MLDSTLLMSAAPKPVDVRACFGLVKAGPTGPRSSDTGALVEGLRSLFCVPLVVDMVAAIVAMLHDESSRKMECEKSMGSKRETGSRLVECSESSCSTNQRDKGVAWWGLVR